MSDDKNNDAGAADGASVEGGSDDHKAVAPVLPGNPVHDQQEMLIAHIAGEAKQLLKLVGLAVDDVSIIKVAAQQFAMQTQLFQQILPTLEGAQRMQFPMFVATFSRPKPRIMLASSAPQPPFQVGGPKQLHQDSAAGEVVGTLAALVFMSQPAVRVVLQLLGLDLMFAQAAPPTPQPRILV